jgi:hypothetical protein
LKGISWEDYSEIEERVLGSLFIKRGEYTGMFIQRLKSLGWKVYLQIQERVPESLLRN